MRAARHELAAGDRPPDRPRVDPQPLGDVLWREDSRFVEVVEGRAAHVAEVARVAAPPPDDFEKGTLLGPREDPAVPSKDPVAPQAAVARTAAGKENPAVAGRSDEALCRTRTGDPFLTMEVLYQLS
jgi:hypothetical protein